MKNSKKIISLFMSLIMALSMFTGMNVTSFALSPILFLRTSTDEIFAGTEFTITVEADSLDGLISADFEIGYDSEYLEFISIEKSPSAEYEMGSGGMISDDMAVWSLMFFSPATISSQSLVDITFIAKKSGVTNITLEILAWDGTDTPAECNTILEIKEDDSDLKETILVITSLSDEIKVGDEFTLTLSANDLANFSTCDLEISYNEEFFEFVSGSGMLSDDEGLAYINRVADGILTASLMLYANVSSDNEPLFDMTFKALKEGNSSISVKINAWEGTKTPNDITLDFLILEGEEHNHNFVYRDEPSINCLENGRSIGWCIECGYEYVEYEYPGLCSFTNGSIYCDVCGKLGLEYEINNGEVSITSCDESISGDISIPAEIEGCPVTAIESLNPNYPNRDITSVTIPVSIKVIGNGAFTACNIENFYYNGTEEQWNCIEMGERNDRIEYTTIHFNSTGPDNPTATPDENKRDSVAQELIDIDIPESEFKKLELPFEWSDVLGYTDSGKYQMFLTIDSYEDNGYENEWGYHQDSYVIDYMIFYTEDYVTWNTAEFSLNTADYPDAWESYGFDINYFLDYSYTITQVNDDGVYYIPISCNAEPHSHFTVGIVFDNDNITFMDQSIAKENLFVFDDRYVMIDNDIPAIVTNTESVTVDGEEKYKSTVTSYYMYSEDFETWTENQGPTTTKISDYACEVGDYDSAFFAYQGYDSMYFIYRPELNPMQVWTREYDGAFVSTNGKDFIQLEKIANAMLPETICYIDDKFVAIDAIYYSEDDRLFGYQITSYDKNGKATVLATWDITDRANFAMVHWYFTFSDSGKNVISFSTSRYDDDLNPVFSSCDIFEFVNEYNFNYYTTEFDLRNPILYGSTDFEGSELNIVLTDSDSLGKRLYITGSSCETAYVVNLDEEFDISDTFGDSLILFGENSYIISRDSINDCLPETPSEPENPTDDPTSDKLDIKNESVKVDEDSKISTIGANNTVENISSAIGNEKFAIVDKNGNMLDGETLVGTGAKIQLLDNDGNILNEYTVVVPSDVDGNGKTTAADARMVLRSSAKLDNLDGVYATAANINKDDKITAADARTILRISAKLETLSL